MHDSPADRMRFSHNPRRRFDVIRCRSRRWSYAVLLACLGLHAASAKASTVIAADEALLTRRADAIVYGVVVDAASSPIAVEQTPYTRIMLQVYRGLKGATDGEFLIFDVPGGQLSNGLFVHADGLIPLPVGQQVFAYLEASAGVVAESSMPVYRPLGLSQGLLPVQQTSTGERIVARHAVPLERIDRRGKTVDDNPAELLAEPLEALFERIRNSNSPGRALMHETRVGRATAALQCDAVQFAPRGDHWAVAPDVSTGTAQTGAITILLQKDGPIQANAIPIGVLQTNVFTLGFLPWTQVNCGNSTRPNLRFVQGALYADRDGGDNANTNTFRNVVYWVEEPSKWPADSLTVALTTTLFTNDNRFIASGDIAFNGVHFDWRASDGTTPVGCSKNATNCFDVATVTLHEVGHLVGFNHVQCTDAVMYPEGTSSDERRSLSKHESVGVCALYPPRTNVTSARATGEQCDSTAQCPTSPAHRCVLPAGFSGSSGYGSCAANCTRDSDCGAAFACATHSDGSKFCLPGINTSLSNINAIPVGELGNCSPCSYGSECESGYCVRNGGTAICSQACSTATGLGCPYGFDCLSTDANYSVCWPQDINQCKSSAKRGQVNDLCYYVDSNSTSSSGNEWYNACDAGLVCFVFQQTTGVCVEYCNNDGGRNCSAGDTCCFGVSNDGICQAPSLLNSVGGCFRLGEEGDSCAFGKEAICAEGTQCFHFGDSRLARCYNTCSRDGDCFDDQECAGFYAADSSVHNLCCNSLGYRPRMPETCMPHAALAYELGTACRESKDCASNYCFTLDNSSACSQSCDASKGTGCPAAIPGQENTGFTCVPLTPGPEGEGRCWPIGGPREPPPTPAPATGGCCNSMGAPLIAGDWVLNGLVWLPLYFFRRKRRV